MEPQEVAVFADKLSDFESALAKLQEKAMKQGVTFDFCNNLPQLLDSWVEVTDKCINTMQEALSSLTPTIHWHPNKKDMLEMFYLSGDSPWSFWLSYNLTSEVDDLLKIIHSAWKNNLLSRNEKPEVGDFVFCCDNKGVFRGYIVSFMTKSLATVLNVDNNQINMTKVASCYEITKQFCELHANTIQCCLTKDKFDEKKWNPNLIALFKYTLRDSRLTVKILDKIDTTPPTFYVELYAFNESTEVETNISHWLTSRLFPALEKLDTDVETELDPEVIDPFTCINNSPPGSESNVGEKGVLKITPAEEPYENNKHHSLFKKPKDSAHQKPLNRLQHFISAEGKKCPEKSPASGNFALNSKTDKMKSPKKEFMFESVIDAPEFKPLAPLHSATMTTPELKPLTSYSKSPPKVKPPAAHLSAKSKPEFKLTAHSPLNPTAEFEPRAAYSLTKSDPVFTTKLTQDLGNIAMSGYNEEPVLPSGYVPKDDQRICSFFAKNNYCWKTSCTKEHKKPVSDTKWTDDSVETYKETFNKIDLPKIGTKANIIVTNVMCANTFYAIIPSSPSDDEETIESLIAQLNNSTYMKELKLLTTPPCFGQLLVAFCSTKNQWLRASVYDVYSNNIIQVFFVDFGITEEVGIDKCREIAPEFIHLPYQAIYCSLANLFVENLQDEDGRAFLEQLTLYQEIEVDIVDSDVRDTRLEVIAYSPTGFSLNDVMVKRGYCSNFQR